VHSRKVELAIVGAGISGVSAAVYAKRSGLDFLLFEEKIVGGQLFLMEKIDNYIGLGLGVKGRELAGDLAKTLADLDIKIIDKRVDEIQIIDKETIALKTKSYDFFTKGVILTTGASFRKLGIEGEDKLFGRGVSYCAVCDGFFFKEKEVAVVGGGNTAVEDALYLSNIAKKVTLIHRREELRAMDYLKKELYNKKNVDIMFSSIVEEVRGNEILEKILVRNVKTKKNIFLPISGLFVAIGITPNNKLIEGKLTTDEQGCIVTNDQMKTSSENIWAAGDCRKRPLKQLITAASEGAIASISAYKYLKNSYLSV